MTQQIHHRRRLHLPRIPRRKRYPIWSVRTVTEYGLVIAGLTAILVFTLGKRSLFVETELTLAIIAAALFAFLAIGLYRGVRVKRKDIPGTDASTVSPLEMADLTPDMLPGLDADGDEGCLAILAGLFLAILAAILLLLALWLVLNLGIVLWVFLTAALSWVFYLALRQVFAKSRVCRGNLGRSLGYALWYTVLYTGWLFALVWIAHGLLGPRLGEP